MRGERDEVQERISWTRQTSAAHCDHLAAARFHLLTHHFSHDSELQGKSEGQTHGRVHVCV